MSSVPNIALPRPQCTLLLGFDGVITHCSPGASAVFGFALIGRHIAALFPEHAADMKSDLDRARKGREERTERLARRANRQARWVDLQHTTEDVPVVVRLEGRERDVVLQVTDRGPGIAPDTLRRLFQPFVRGTQSGASGRSVGLGLFISRATAEAHEGTVSCESAHGKGTTFTVVLPREGRLT